MINADRSWHKTLDCSLFRRRLWLNYRYQSNCCSNVFYSHGLLCGCVFMCTSCSLVHSRCLLEKCWCALLAVEACLVVVDRLCSRFDLFVSGYGSVIVFVNSRFYQTRPRCNLADGRNDFSVWPPPPLPLPLPLLLPLPPLRLSLCAN